MLYFGKILVVAVMLQHGVNFGDSCDAIKIGVSICYNTLWCGVFGAFMVSHYHMHFLGDLGFGLWFW